MHSLINPAVIRAELALKNKSLSTIADQVKSVYEDWHGQPERFFFFKLNQQEYCGQKLISPLVFECQAPTLFCSHIKMDMLLGLVLRTQCSEGGVRIFYKTLSLAQRHAIFETLLQDRMIDLYFPFVHLNKDHHAELTSPEQGWVIDEETANFLARGEAMQVEVSLELLREDAHPAPVIYDPACSTGHFLYALKQSIPTATVIGQDLSQSMCDRARPLLDQVIHGDAFCPEISYASCDYIFFRFLNAEVVNTETAMTLFKAIIPCLKPTGKAILFGFTPVLIALPELMQQGFRTLACNAAHVTEGTLIQYYVISPAAGLDLPQQR